MTLCNKDPEGWISNITRAGGSARNGRSYEIMWDLDPKFNESAEGGYVVSYRKFGSRNQTLIMPVSQYVRVYYYVCNNGDKYTQFSIDQHEPKTFHLEFESWNLL